MFRVQTSIKNFKIDWTHRKGPIYLYYFFLLLKSGIQDFKRVNTCSYDFVSVASCRNMITKKVTHNKFLLIGTSFCLPQLQVSVRYMYHFFHKRKISLAEISTNSDKFSLQKFSANTNFDTVVKIFWTISLAIILTLLLG